jgi:hypothetical protein
MQISSVAFEVCTYHFKNAYVIAVIYSYSIRRYMTLLGIGHNNIRYSKPTFPKDLLLLSLQFLQKGREVDRKHKKYQ